LKPLAASFASKEGGYVVRTRRFAALTLVMEAREEKTRRPFCARKKWSVNAFPAK
jgi:hypothetical protein